MYADLHLHSYYSDGTLAPLQIARQAAAKGIGILSVTDHNTRAAYPEISAACAQFGLKLIKGVEIDCVCGELWLHVLAYNARREDAALNALLAEILDIYEQKSVDMLERLSKTDPRVTLAEYRAYVRDRSRGGWAGIDYLRTKGYDIFYPDCMSLYRGIDWCRPLPELKTVCDIVRAAGGTVVLAHPGDRLPRDPAVFVRTLERLADVGVDGVECYYPSHSAAQTAACVDFCRRRGLAITAGSDSHGGFARLVDGVCYDMGAVLIDESALNLAPLL